MTARRPEFATVSKGARAKCVFCGERFSKPYLDNDERCWGCRADNAPMTLARRGALGECSFCGTAVSLEDRTLTHLDPERDEFHRATQVNAD